MIKGLNIIKDKDDTPCSGRIDFNYGQFNISYSAWGCEMPDFQKLGWKPMISWHPTYTVKTKSIKIVRNTIACGLNRISKRAFDKLKKYK